MQGIIVGVDESANAAEALRWAVAEGAWRKQPVTAVLSWGYLDQHHATPDRPFDPEYHEADAQAALAGLVEHAVGPDAEVEQRAVCDLPARTLIEAGAGAELVVVGSRGIGGFRGLLLGSVSRQVLHHAPCPVAVVRPSADGASERIVVGVDGSDVSRAALAWALDEGRARQAQVVAVHAWQAAIGGYGYMAPIVEVETLETAARQLVERELDAVDTSGLPTPVEHHIVVDGGAAAILAAAEGATLVVVGARGRGGFKGLLLGSVSDQITQHATCPVVVVPHGRE